MTSYTDILLLGSTKGLIFDWSKSQYPVLPTIIRSPRIKLRVIKTMEPSIQADSTQRMLCNALQNWDGLVIIAHYTLTGFVGDFRSHQMISGNLLNHVSAKHSLLRCKTLLVNLY